jgi:hypothetical protein
METRNITSKEQQCIGECINKYWGHDRENFDNDDARDSAYEQCLSSCQVCG